jgi:hypothetical protein
MTNLTKYERACNALLDDFINIYFVDDDFLKEDIEYNWIADEVGTIALINDYFISMDTIYQALDLKMEKDDFFDWYDQWVDIENNKRINLKNWVYINKKTND